MALLGGGGVGAYSRVGAYKLFGLSGWALNRINTVFLYVGLRVRLDRIRDSIGRVDLQSAASSLL